MKIRLLSKLMYGLISLLMLLVLGVFGFDVIFDRYIEAQLVQSVDNTILQDEQLHIVFCGTGTLSSDVNRVGSCVAIVAGGETYVFDTGAGSVRVLANTDIPLGSISTVFFTHFHSDHFADFGELMVASRIMGRTSSLNAFGPSGVDAVVQGFSDAFAIDHLFREKQHGKLLPTQAAIANSTQVDLKNYADRVELIARNGVSISAFLVNHAPVAPALGYRIEYGGRVVVISGDTKRLEALSVHAKGADILIHEAMDKEFAKRIIRVGDEIGHSRLAKLVDDALLNHSSEVDAAQIAQLAKVGLLFLTHISPPMDNFIMRYLFVNSAEEHFDGEVILAEDGLRYDLEILTVSDR